MHNCTEYSIIISKMIYIMSLVTQRGAIMQAAVDIKSAAHELIDSLSDEEVSWDSIAYEIDVRASIERGLSDVKSGNVVSMEEMLEEFSLQE